MIDLNSRSLEQGSFRDSHGQVFYHGGEVMRGLNPQGLEDWEALYSSVLFQRLLDGAMLVQTEQVVDTSDLEVITGRAWAAYLRHERIPYVSYPYEWPFGMLKDAGLLQLDLLQMLLDEDMILKDASAFNVQWKGAHPLFIDVPSIQRLKPGEPWVGYRQFCEMFLIPLFLTAFKGIDFHSWLRGSIDGIPVDVFARLLSMRDLVRPGVLKHIYLQSKLQYGYEDSGRNVKVELRSAGFNKDLVRANARGISKLVRNLEWRKPRSEWSNYTTEHSYAETDFQEKVSFVRKAAHTRRWKLTWDLGCNTGTFSRIAAETSDYVVAMDSDHLAVERLYQSLKADSSRNILPLVNNLADPSPALGWRLQERKNLVDRGRPELTLCLALIHHMVIGANIPMRDFVSWLASLRSDLIIEFVSKDDPMVQKLLRNKDDNYPDYDIDLFESWLSEHFNVENRQVLDSTTRVLYFARFSGSA